MPRPEQKVQTLVPVEQRVTYNVVKRNPDGTIAKGSTGNPGGRSRLPPEALKVAKQNGEQAVYVMQQMLTDNTLFGPGGWMDPRDQLRLLELAMNRAYGVPREPLKDEREATELVLTSLDKAIQAMTVTRTEDSPKAVARVDKKRDIS